MPLSGDYYFEPVNQEPRGTRTFELPCRLIYELLHRPGEGYAYTWEEAVKQRTERARLFETVPITPRPRFLIAAREFWSEKFGASHAPVLGVHYRGVDKNGAKFHL